MKALILISCLVALGLAAQFDNDEVIARTKVGIFHGYRNRIEGKTVNVFKGIRYGQAPIVERRFKRPLAHNSDSDVHYNATEYAAACHYWESIGPPTPVSEDCLFLNVYAPVTTESVAMETEFVPESVAMATDAKEAKKLPVMFWLHGGGFVGGTAMSDMYRGDYLAALGEVVIVTVNYRLGALGFMYGGSKDEAGNQGLYDQLLALEWVRDNIEAFGGDKEQITVFGESAGSWSVSAHLLSPHARGLFKRGISESGAFFGKRPTFAGSAAENEVQTLMYARDLKCLPNAEKKLSKEIMDCIRSRPIKDLMSLSVSMMDSKMTYQSGFEDEFMPLNPVEAVRAGNFSNAVDYVFGVNDDEGALFVISAFPDDFNPDHHREHFTLRSAQGYIRTLMQFGGHPDRAKEAAAFYTNNVNATDGDALREAVAAVFGDLYIVCPTVQFGKFYGLHNPNVNTYSYRLTRKANVFRYVFPCRGWTGVCHAEEITSVFGWPFYNFFSETVYNDDDRKFSREIIKAWSTFAKTGKMPKLNGAEWQQSLPERSDKANVQYLQLDYPQFQMVQDRYVDNCDRFFKE